jgi:hypothetical protein
MFLRCRHNLVFLNRSWFDAALFVIFATVVSLQLFVPPYIGMADNGDFAKIAARHSLDPADPGHGYKYFNADYILSKGSHWESDFRSSEEWPAAIAFYLSRTTKEGEIFNIRWLGAVHATILLVVFGLVLVATREMSVWSSLCVVALVVWIFSDVLYVSYLNSFYSDTAALLGLLGGVVLAILIIAKGPQISLVFGFSLFAILLIASKSQHALWGFLPALFLLVTTRKEDGEAQWLGAGMSALLLVGVVIVIASGPAHYKGEARFDLIFQKLAKISPDPQHALRELGLPASDERYIGFTAYEADSPASDNKWFIDFCRRTSYFRVAEYYLRHPVQAVHILRTDLESWARYIRFDFGNFRRQDAVRPGQRSERFASWSDLRTRLFFWWPYHILVWYALLVTAIILILHARVSTVAVRLAWLTAGLTFAAGAEYCISSLADSVETFRHLFLFHALTDITVCLSLTALLSGTFWASLNKIADLRSPRRTGGPSSRAWFNARPSLIGSLHKVFLQQQNFPGVEKCAARFFNVNFFYAKSCWCGLAWSREGAGGSRADWAMPGWRIQAQRLGLDQGGPVPAWHVGPGASNTAGPDHAAHCPASTSLPASNASGCPARPGQLRRSAGRDAIEGSGRTVEGRGGRVELAARGRRREFTFGHWLPYPHQH